MTGTIVFLAVALLLVWMALSVWRRSRAATPIDPDDPLMLAAIRHARASIDALRELHAAGNEVAIKFPIRDGDGEIEHVWGGLQSVGVDVLQAEIATPLVVGKTPRGPQRVSISDLEDWQTFLPDGRIRGGFTTQAQIALCRRDRHPIPRNILNQEDRFVDRLDPTASQATP